jgi:hypothetical protein
MTANAFRGLAAASLTLVATAASVAADPSRAGAAPPSALPARVGAPTLNRGEVRVNAGDLRLIAVQTNIAALTKEFDKLSGDAKAYEAMAKAIPGMAQACAAKAYGAQDQAAAGCTGGDTVAQCADKLLKHCMANYKGTSLSIGIGMPGGEIKGVPIAVAGNANRGIKVGFSLQEFQQKATAAAAEARALSQQLAAYASQVELNAKKVLP